MNGHGSGSLPRGGSRALVEGGARAAPEARPDVVTEVSQGVVTGAERVATPAAPDSVLRSKPAPPCAFVIFGVTGDLTARKLIPALYQLAAKGELNERSVIVGHARRAMSDEELREYLGAKLEEEVPDFDADLWRRLAERISYVQGDYRSDDGFVSLAQELAGLEVAGNIFYTATPPETYAGIGRLLANAGLAENKPDKFSRLVVEKPFGHDEASAKALNAELLEEFDEPQIFRIDHYLAKETAQNLGVLRFANTMFEPVWNNRYIDHVQITMIEPIGVEERGNFYESAGVLRDVFQNHLLQLLALVSMEPPVRFDAKAVRDEKVKLFSAVQCPDPKRTIIGQYVAGNGMVGYRQEPNVDPRSKQATYAAMELTIDNWRWAGVPFYLRSGKRLEAKASEIVLQFKAPPHIPFNLSTPVHADTLVMRIVPDEGMTIRFNGKRPGQKVELDRIGLDFSYQRSFTGAIPDAYETLILDVMQGDATLFMRADEVEAQWRIMDPVLDYLEREKPTPHFYEAGGMGPQAAYEMLLADGRQWKRPAGVDR